MSIGDLVSITLLIGAFLLLVFSIFLFIAGSLAKYEVSFHGKNGLTWLLGTFLYSVGFFLLMTSAMAFYAALEPLQTRTFLVMAWGRNLGIIYAFFICGKLVFELRTPPPEQPGD